MPKRGSFLINEIMQPKDDQTANRCPIEYIAGLFQFVKNAFPCNPQAQSSPSFSLGGIGCFLKHKI